MAGWERCFTFMASDAVLQVKRVSKSFPGVRALDDVSMDVRAGEVHCLVGQNGAGKSTLIKILGGAYRMDSGEVYLEGRRVSFPDPDAALRAGISVLYQELALNPYLSAAENIFLGNEFRVARFGVSHARAVREAARLIEPFGVEVDLRVPVGELSVAQQQVVALAKALSHRSKVVILDEPSAVLTSEELGKLFSIIARLCASGVTVIYISHRLEEIFAIGDRVTVLRDGKVVGTHPVGDVTQARLVGMMIGREVGTEFPRTRRQVGDAVLEARNLTRHGVLDNVSFALRKGEILGVFGLVGAGRTELARVLVGADRPDSGRVFLDGQPLRLASPQRALRLGIGLVPEDRKAQGLVPAMTVADNVTISMWDRLSTLGLVRVGALAGIARRLVGELGIKTPSISTQVQNLSGGNQQKVVLSRLIAGGSKVLVFDEPTRGVDIGAKLEIYNLMNVLVSRGLSVMMISSELPEVMGVSDRVLVMRKGRVAGVFDPGTASQEKVLACAMGVSV